MAKKRQKDGRRKIQKRKMTLERVFSDLSDIRDALRELYLVVSELKEGVVNAVDEKVGNSRETARLLGRLIRRVPIPEGMLRLTSGKRQSKRRP